MKNIYVTWHYTTHGVAYLKHILSGFYKQQRIPTEKIHFTDFSQTSLNEVFNNPDKTGFVFDQIIYLTASQDTFDKLSSRRLAYKKIILSDELIISRGLDEIYKHTLEDEDISYIIDKELEFVQKYFPEKKDDFIRTAWRNIQHYSISEQLKWLISHSNFPNVYKDKLIVKELEVLDLRNEQQITEEVNNWLIKFLSKNPSVNLFINVSLGSTETQVAWHILAESGRLPSNTRFIKTYDDKSANNEDRFKPFSIIEIQTNLISSLSKKIKLFENTKSSKRALVNKKMETLINTGFSILLIGERGTGKSRIADSAKVKLIKEKEIRTPFRSANCASFADDTMAESELFGYSKGAFTGAIKDKVGLFIEADNGILFLDEIHHLSKRVQAKLMKALQTDEHNKMSIRPVGSNIERKVECRLIFATNKNVNDLKECLLPDFYDRIVQHVIDIPPLRETIEDRDEDWEAIWSSLKFNGAPKCPKNSELISWLKELPLFGNFRDLQKIAIYYNAYNQYDDETKKMLIEKSAFEYSKNEFEKYHSPETVETSSKYNFNTNQTTKEMIADYLYALQEWSVTKFKGKSKAINHYKILHDTVCEKTFSNWKNKTILKGKEGLV
jgi:transcriptional regulator with AAA-type ATPase domain